MEKQAKEPLCVIRDIHRLINDFESGLQSRCGVGLNEGMLLCSLSRMGKCTSGQIAGALGLTPSNASKVIMSAERKGLVERIVGQEDRRQMLFSLTPQGEKCITNIECHPEDILRRIDTITRPGI